MIPRTATIARRSTAFLVALALPALALHPRPVSAEANTCTLVQPADATALLGAGARQKPTPGGAACTWSGADGAHKIAVLTYKNRPGAPPEMIYMGARKGAEGEGGKVGDEAGIGERAFSAQVSFGVVFVAIKHGRVIQLQYYTGAHGTAKDLTAFRPVVRRAVAAF